MIAALQVLQSRFSSQPSAAQSFSFEVIDIDQHPTLEAQYGDKVPVLMSALEPALLIDAHSDKGDGAESMAQTEICHYFLDEAKLLAHLGAPHGG